MAFHLKHITYIILISLFFSFIRYFFIDGDYPLIKTNDINEMNYTSNSNLDSLKRYLYEIKHPEMIDFTFAKKIHDNKLATFIDARDNESYNDGHIQGAINVPFDYVIDEINPTSLKEFLYEEFTYGVDRIDFVPIFKTDFFSIVLDKDDFVLAQYDFSFKEDYNNLKKVFVIYCSGVGCSLSEDLSMYLYENFKINRILIYEGGMPEWNFENKDYK